MQTSWEVALARQLYKTHIDYSNLPISIRGLKWVGSGDKCAGLVGFIRKMDASSQADQKSINFCFTCNNWTQAIYDALMNYSNAVYVIIGKEVAPSTGTPHLQGYFRMRSVVRKSTLHRQFPGVHFIIARGTPQENIDYCSKDGDFQERGDRPDVGSRTSGWLDSIEYMHSTLREVEGDLLTLLPEHLHGNDRINKLRDVQDVLAAMHTDMSEFYYSYVGEGLPDELASELDKIEECDDEDEQMPPRKRANTEVELVSGEYTNPAYEVMSCDGSDDEVLTPPYGVWSKV